MQEQHSLREAFAAMNERYAADPAHAKAQEHLRILRETVDRFQAEGFAVRLDVRPEQDRCDVANLGDLKLKGLYANGTIDVDGTVLNFIVGRQANEREIRTFVAWGGEIMMNRAATYDSSDRTWNDYPVPVYSGTCMDQTTREQAKNPDFATALSAVILHVLVQNGRMTKYAEDAAPTDKPAKMAAPARLRPAPDA
jgi:hypothetical protein